MVGLEVRGRMVWRLVYDVRISQEQANTNDTFLGLRNSFASSTHQ